MRRYNNLVVWTIQGSGQSPGTLNQRIYVQQDANYNVTSVTDTSGNVLERYIYSPYGEQTVLNPDGTVKGDGTPASSSYNLPVGFQGMLFDPVLSDNLTPNRVYDPMLGTWTSEDPDGAAGSGDNLYQADNGAPEGVVDPLGLAPDPEFAIYPTPASMDAPIRALIAKLDSLRPPAGQKASLALSDAYEALLNELARQDIESERRADYHWDRVNKGPNYRPTGDNMTKDAHEKSFKWWAKERKDLDDEFKAFRDEAHDLYGLNFTVGAAAPGPPAAPPPPNPPPPNPQQVPPGQPPPGGTTVDVDPFSDGGPWESFEDATGIIGGDAEELEKIGEAKDLAMRREGFTEKWVGKDPDSGDYYSAYRNPKTGKWASGKLSSRNAD